VRTDTLCDVLHANEILRRDGIAIADVACRHDRGAGTTDEYTGGHALVFVRRGCFVHRHDGLASVMDATVAFAMAPGAEVGYDHPHAGGDDCTHVALEPALVASLWGGDPALPARPLPTSAAIDLEHRLLLAAGRAGADPHELVERAIALVARTLALADPRRVAAGRPATASARRVLADRAREALADDPGRSLPALARDLAVSPHHLSRLFVAATGATIARHRMVLRTRGALERLAGGERDLARLAAELGFADQSHLSRVVGAQTGRTPGALRLALAPA
jgi:AraC-like DNA-binding protein